MTITPGVPPRRNPPVALARGFLTGVVSGGSLAALVVGIVADRPLIAAALIALPAYGLLLLLAARWRREREGADAPWTALALVEALDPAQVPTSDVPVRFELTVVPDGQPAFRVAFTQEINVVDLPDYRPGGVLVVRYPPGRPWRARIVKRPTPVWEERARGARIDSVPGAADVTEPPKGAGAGFLGFLGLLLAAAAVVLAFRADLFGPQAARPQGPVPSPTSWSTSSGSTTVVANGSGTILLGPGRSFLQGDELRRSVASLTKDGEAGPVMVLHVREGMLTVAYATAGTADHGFDATALPFERFPALVEEARTTLGVHTPQTWGVTVTRLTGTVTIAVSVTGPEGTAVLETDDHGRELRRTSPH
ncbi:DUF3592 domain-containing protein [Kitasatospora sp. NPDC056651]|uniref:DUF3592 domain-containing protein n=1 Tax=Kitasatospora sp. NPDC056651 TaxID=3345892 RepID=UPI0036C30374